MQSNPLNTFGTVILSGSGAGTVKISPPPNVRWMVSSASVATNQDPNNAALSIPTCNIYVGGQAIPANFVDGTYTGNQDSTDQTQGIPIYGGQAIFAVWANGPAGALATLSIYGTADSGYRGQ